MGQRPALAAIPAVRRSVRRSLHRVSAQALRRAWDWATIAGAVGPGDERGRRFGAFGAGSLLAFPQGAVFNERYIHIGEGTMVGPYASLTAGMAPGQEMLTSPVVRIGDRCVIGRGSHIVGHWSVDIGDDVQTGPYVYVTDQNHAYEDPHVPIGRQWPVEAGVSVGAGSWLGANSVVLPGAVIGRQVVVAAGAVVRGKVPDHCVVAGVPARIVRRWFPQRGWVDVGEDGAGEDGAREVGAAGVGAAGVGASGVGAAGVGAREVVTADDLLDVRRADVGSVPFDEAPAAGVPPVDRARP
jgi:serine acetyltransferase